MHLLVHSPTKRANGLEKTRSNFSNGHTLEPTPNATAVRDDIAAINDEELLNHLILAENLNDTPVGKEAINTNSANNGM